ncbi:MAG: hypothetical protein ABUS56_02340, partial [Acidobacteriota bacterium]
MPLVVFYSLQTLRQGRTLHVRRYNPGMIAALVALVSVLAADSQPLAAHSQPLAAQQVGQPVAQSAPQPVPQPFPRPGTQAAPPTVGQPAPATAPNAAPAPAQPDAAPTEATLGVPIYPGAQFLGSYNAGRGQRYYLFGSPASFVDLVAYYR